MKLFSRLPYFPFEEKSLLLDKMRALTKFCSKENKKLAPGCDASAHHTVWRSTDCNKRGDELLEDILMFNLCLLNQGN